MRICILLAIILLAVIYHSPHLAAQQLDSCGCEAALKKDFVQTISTDEQKYSYVSQIDQTQYEELKHSGGGGISIPFLDELLNASANWSDFQARRSTYGAHKHHRPAGL
jgi:hypothetical protein